ncbi:hypothetical protein FQN52_000175 [Onygenales sp. PD_12]|nr:hypothetical protein FQN52_000175 [Onygenales sp. PD_12]
MGDQTQLSTQPYADPRRVGLNNSGLDEGDVPDIICVLHPNTLSAHGAVSATARSGPQHILQRDSLEYDTGSQNSSSGDIALRLSSGVKDLSMGFCFGRNPSRCDIVLSRDDSEKKISNVHFRIYLTQDNILMLQDTSTNGTYVDDNLIRKDRKYSTSSTQMLVPGSIIHVANSSPAGIKFIVRIPPRDGFERQYTHNVIQYINRVQNACKKVEAAVGRPVKPGRADPVIVSQQGAQAHGMNWNGGSKYNVTGQIGKGAFATVYKVATKNDGAIFACKELDKRRFMKNNILDYKVNNEMMIMSGLRHPNIVEFRDYHDHGNRWIYIIMEYVPGGELSTYMSQCHHLPEDQVKSIARQVLHALQYLHRRKITHRDIKPDNILIQSYDPLHVKLSDFGLSKVAQEESFMKTFCGTLLYCAPEVYPEYDNYRRGEARKRRRAGDPIPRTSPYDQSVDMWSFGAVTFHILCGSPPYAGRGDDRGAQMLRTIMTTDADFDLLRDADVSEDGVGFVSKLLNRDPKARPKEPECLHHPWIVDFPDLVDYTNLDGPEIPEIDTALDAVGEVDEDEEALDASGIDLNDRIDENWDEELDDEEDQQETPTDQNVKRQRTMHDPDEPDNQVIMAQPPVEITYPSLPDLDSYSFGPSIHIQGAPPPPPLFGEITPAALRSSGAFDHHIAQPQNIRSFQNQYQSGDANDYQSSGIDSSSSWSSMDHPIQTEYQQLPASLERGSSAPSLMGAESLVGQLHMESPDGRSPISTTPNSNNPTTPEASDGHPSSSQRDGPKIGSQHGGKNPSDQNADAQKSIGGQQSSHLTPAHPSSTSRNEVKGNSISHASVPDATPRAINPNLALELATTIDERTGEEVSRADGPEGDSENDDADPSVNEDLHPSQASPGAINTKASLATPMPFGILTTLPGSIADVSIQLESRMTSWGRGPRATIRYSNPMDDRVPAYALELTFWAPSIESRIAAGEDWTKIPNVMTILSTKASNCIWVNDVELRKEARSKDARLFGKLYTGDIITVYRDREKYLRFRCEFYHGESAQQRPLEERGFIIQKAKYSQSKSTSQASLKTIQGITADTDATTTASTLAPETVGHNSTNWESDKESRTHD